MRNIPKKVNDSTLTRRSFRIASYINGFRSAKTDIETRRPLNKVYYFLRGFGFCFLTNLTIIIIVTIIIIAMIIIIIIIIIILIININLILRIFNR